MKNMKWFQLLFLLTQLLFRALLIFGRKGGDYSDTFFKGLYNNNTILGNRLRHALLLNAGGRSILWKISRENNIFTDLIDDVLHDAELNHVLIDGSIIMCEMRNKHILDETTNFVVVTHLDAIENFSEYLKCFKYAKYLVFVDRNILGDEKLDDLLKLMWNNDIFDVTIATQQALVNSNSSESVSNTNKVSNDSMKYYTWFPLDGDSDCGNVVNLVETQQLFPQKLSKYLPNCAIKCAFVDDKPFSQLYGDTLVLMSEMAGNSITFDNKKSEYGVYFYWEENMMDMLENDTFDVIYGHTFINSTEFFYGPMFYTDSAYIAARKPHKLSDHHPILKSFNLYLWVFIVFIYFVVCVVAVVLATSDRSVFLDIFRISLGNSLPTFNNKARVLNILFLTYSCYSLIMTNAYLSKLSSGLTKPVFARPFANREDIYLSALSLYFNAYVDKIHCLIYAASDNPTALSYCIKLNISIYELLEKVVHDQNNTATTYMSMLETYPHLANRIDYFPTFFDTATFYNSYVLRKDNPKNAVINYWSCEIIEKGLAAKWWKDIKRTSEIKWHFRSASDDNPPPFIVLTLSHFYELFLIVAYGYLLSFLALLFEFFAHNCMKKIQTTSDISAF